MAEPKIKYHCKGCKQNHPREICIRCGPSAVLVRYIADQPKKKKVVTK